MPLSKSRLEFTTAGFLSEMRRQFVKLNPGKDSPIRDLDDYSPEQRSALMAAIDRSVQYAGEDGEKAYLAWMERRSAAASL